MTGATVHPLRCPRSGKLIYGSLARADHFRARLEAEMHCAYRIYRCEFCGWFHLSSQRKRALG